MGHDGNKCIARKLNISITTLNNHIRTMHDKAGTCNKTQLVFWAFRQAKRMMAQETALSLTYCDCGMVARWRGRVAIASANGHQRDNWLNLCEDCKSNFDGEIQPYDQNCLRRNGHQP